MSRIADREVRILACYSEALQADTSDADEAWQGSPFAWIKKRPSRQVGAIGEKLVAGYLAAKGFDVVRSPDGEADRLVNGARAEIKLSTLWKNGSYKFQQLRDQNYEFVICLGLSPFDAHCWVLPKGVVLTQWDTGGITSQHGGQAGRDTAWLHVHPDSVPLWLRDRGGTLSQAVPLIAEMTGQAPLP